MKIFFFLLFYYSFLLWYGIEFLSFSIVEVKSIEHFWPLEYILQFSFSLFGHNDFALRLPQIIISFLSSVLFLKISEDYFEKRSDIFFNLVIFLLIPGFIISSLIVNKSIYLLFCTLLFIYFYKHYRFFSYLLLILYIFLDYSFISLYFALVFFAIYKRDSKFLLFVLILLAVNANFFDYRITGKPRGYFLDVLGTYILIFSPFVFIYFLYTLYKGFFFKKDIIFFISVFSFLLSILLSFRQRIKIDDFAPYVLPYVIFMVKIFLSSYRVRLPVFRKWYRILFIFLFATIIIFDIALFLNRYTPARGLSGSFYFI
ncbi:MAG: hypothetical protein ABGX25_01305, partial [Nautiliaceae bacterium]